MFTVVVAIDDDNDQAVSQAETIVDLAAEGLNVQALLLHVFHDNPEGASVAQIGAVDHARELLEAADVRTELHELSGDPATQILAFAEDQDADALCVAGRKQSPSRKAVFGSVTQSVLLNSDRPVFVPGIDAGN